MRADEQHDLAAVRQRLHDLRPRLAAGGDVVGADIGHALALRRVAVGGEQHGLGGDLVQLLGRVRRVVHRDGNARDPARHQIVQLAPLRRGGALGGDDHLHVVVGVLLLRLLDAPPGEGPEIGRDVGDEDQGLLLLCLGGAAGAQPGHQRARQKRAHELPHSVAPCTFPACVVRQGRAIGPELVRQMALRTRPFPPHAAD